MINTIDLLRTPLKKSKAYVAGVALAQVTPGEKVFKLNANENQFGPSTKALEAMAGELANGYLYPGTVLTDLKEKLAQFYGLQTENITVYNGSGSAINAMGETFLNPEDEVLICSPTYMAYAPLPGRFGAKLVEVPAIDGLYTDLDALAGGITEKTKLIFICNPNNPTGTLLDNDKLEAFINQLPEHVICIIDEAYFDWIDVPGYKSAFRFVNSGKNVIVLRTFSKIYGMAGCRVGFAAASRELTECLYTSSNLFYTNRIGAAGAIAALDDTEFYHKAFENNKEQRAYLTEEMQKMGITTVESQASFIYFDAHCDNDKCMEVLTSHGVYIRPFGLQYLRVSIGLPHQNQAFLDAMKLALEVSRS